MGKKMLVNMTEDERVKAVADALNDLNMTDEEQDLPICDGLVLHMQVGSDCDLEEDEWNSFQKENGGAAGVYFCVTDEDGEDADLGGGQFDSLAADSAEIPDGMRFRLARAVLDNVEMDRIMLRLGNVSAK